MTISLQRTACQSFLAALAFTVALVAAPAWSQDNVTTVDCRKSFNTADCIDKPRSAAEAEPTKAPSQAMWPGATVPPPAKAVQAR
jgi:hypothetical protein